MQPFTKEQFKRKYLQGHTELQISECLSKNGSLIKHSPGDKNIRKNKKIPGKAIIEKIEYDKRADLFKHYLMDAVEVKGAEILDMDIKDLLTLVVKTIPTKVENKHTAEFTFADMVMKANKLEKVETIDADTD